MPRNVFCVWRSRRGSAMELRALMPLSSVLATLDPFNNPSAREQWRLLRSSRGW